MKFHILIFHFLLLILLLREFVEKLFHLSILFLIDYESFLDAEQRDDYITVEKVKNGLFSIEGPGIERLLGYTNMADERGFVFFQKFMREKGIIDKLEALGIEENDTVRIYELEFDYWK